mmetsp:Transcript_60840/g.170530  ORF Transcript_60840/g.170530 Transcript_60840/m.170530 type:complete len:192 (-) Transcript_60840:85-660(-)|eukprot:CAMPEP_0176218136 /NCGR_PEP_ID=MMETSP0121_2-20121125/18049_1 /TAXON_ID=160619 /ORGANISM="Kryptoperidinium foliaceum, Strain CCMP 1326" /LENGTH=191 /DNA_ID=CAMNT_0017557281 /DNA_START=55 /DNA_END=630 /DNA_ORIENTATION=-
MGFIRWSRSIRKFPTVVSDAVAVTAGRHPPPVGALTMFTPSLPSLRHLPAQPMRTSRCAAHGDLARAFATRTGRGDVDTDKEQIDETRFHDKADQTLSRLHDALDTAELDDIDDIALDDGVLSIKLESGGSFVINKHFATRQIWYASPVSGALYFSYTGDSWLCEARGETLEHIVRADLVKLCPAAADVSF